MKPYTGLVFDDCLFAKAKLMFTLLVALHIRSSLFS